MPLIATVTRETMRATVKSVIDNWFYIVSGVVLGLLFLLRAIDMRHGAAHVHAR